MTDLQKLAKELIQKGFYVLCNKKYKSSYFTFSNGKQIGYIQENIYHIDYDFAKNHIASRENGTAISTLNQALPTIENCIHTLNAYDNATQYRDMTHFIEYEKKFYKDYGTITENEIQDFII